LLAAQTRSDGGFSLVEIMVALFIVGLASGFIILSIPRTPTPLEADRIQLENALRTSARIATFSGEPQGILIEDLTVQPLFFRDGVWQPPRDVGSLTAFTLSEDVRVNMPGKDEPRFNTTEEEDPLVRPDIWFDAGGIATEKEFQLAWKASAYRFEVDRSGNVNVVQTGSR